MAIFILFVSACGNGSEDPVTITLVTHDSFTLSKATLSAFTDETGIVVEQLQSGDAGQLVSEAILTSGNPVGDVLFGIDNSFLQRGLDANLFLAYESPLLDQVPDEFELDAQHRVTPIDYGDVCANYWTAAFEDSAVPSSLDDLIDPAFRDSFVTENPETSSPGLAFLLATIARYGEDGWEQYWSALRDNGLSVTSGWEDAYYGEFIAGGGDRSIVMSYASSPAVGVLYSDPPVDTPPTGVLFDSCFRQIEFAGILAGTSEVDAAQQLIDFMLGTTFQEDLPLNMFVYPVNQNAVLPEVFLEHAQLSDNPLLLDWETIGKNRDTWTDRWVELVLR
ncbi:MAG: thiamine ABC transporter substrate-binding protein [Acidimicrobiales bacterium]